MKKYDVFELVTHLRKCPDAFLKSSIFIIEKGINSSALIYDTYRLVNNDFLNNDFNIPGDGDLKGIDDNHWKAIHISIWLLNHHCFANTPSIVDKLYVFWFEELSNTSAYVNFKKWVNDEERAEEMVRLLLKCCEVLPSNENLEEAADKLSSLSSVDRHKVIEDSYNAHERVMKIKKEMAEKKAREAANAYGRE
ncbi:hypothetical protein CXF68_14255 [Tenacibaculum sp. Bg11-29]|uniref:hypothetical protein n=1 Tax=Tenacibaculum sp. Bg11-29 TaxID=2058306 RepID=UPI000C31D048|nr:hypothetical protein [Tenacibaculum sp. Bg11-29]PKH51775.1 hypothetical protein CXF68_14255 [Tenacibaculum sp. Bg11-29]